MSFEFRAFFVACRMSWRCLRVFGSGRFDDTPPVLTASNVIYIRFLQMGGIDRGRGYMWQLLHWISTSRESYQRRSLSGSRFRVWLNNNQLFGATQIMGSALAWSGNPFKVSVKPCRRWQTPAIFSSPKRYKDEGNTPRPLPCGLLEAFDFGAWCTST